MIVLNGIFVVMLKLVIPILLLFVAFPGGPEIRKINVIELEDYVHKSDHPMVVSFWATWCAPCVEEIPYLQKEVQQNADARVEFVLVSLDFKDAYPSKIAAAIEKHGFQARHFWLNETNADYFCPIIDSSWDGSIPATLLINPKTGYRKFFDRQLTPRQAQQEIAALAGK